MMYSVYFVYFEFVMSIYEIYIDTLSVFIYSNCKLIILFGDLLNLLQLMFSLKIFKSCLCET